MIKIKVEKDKRTSNLSKIYGGSTIIVKKRNHKNNKILLLEYDNIKNVDAYIRYVKEYDPNFITYWLKGEGPESTDIQETNDENKDINTKDDLPFK